MDKRTAAGAAENRLIAALGPDDCAALLRHSERLTLPLKQVLYQPGARIDYGYFLTSGMASLLVETSTGGTAEVATVGKEGFVGAPLLLGARTSYQKTIIQIPAEAQRIPSDIFLELVHQRPGLRGLLLRYTLALLNQVSQIVACNRLHSAEERMCRWLLTAERHVGPSFQLTQEFLALMLGVRRPTVTTIAGELQSAGLIRSSRGHVEIIDAQGLERQTCECYRAIAREFERLAS